MPGDPMTLGRLKQFLPQLRILDRLLVGSPPAIAQPAVDPLGNAVADIIAVGVKLDPAWLGESVEALDRRLELHPVVGCQRLAADDFLLPAAGANQRRPSAWAGISPAGTVGENLNRGKVAHAI